MKSQSFFVAALVCLAAAAQAQRGTGGDTGPRTAPDTNMVFRSPRPLVEPADTRLYRDSWGIDVLFSNFGFGGGAFYRHEYTSDLTGFVTLDISGVKNPDEITLYDPYTGLLVGPANKVNDIFMMPVAVGVQYRILSDVISENLRPFINAGAGPTMILAAPDSLEFFSGIGHAAIHWAPDVFVGLGANFGSDKRVVTSVNFRYYYIPYKPGVESILGQPITEFGGFFITLNWGIAW